MGDKVPVESVLFQFSVFQFEIFSQQILIVLVKVEKQIISITDRPTNGPTTDQGTYSSLLNLKKRVDASKSV